MKRHTPSCSKDAKEICGKGMACRARAVKATTKVGDSITTSTGKTYTIVAVNKRAPAGQAGRWKKTGTATGYYCMPLTNQQKAIAGSNIKNKFKNAVEVCKGKSRMDFRNCMRNQLKGVSL